MTTYEVHSRDSEHILVASWPDLPERASHEVATFAELKLAAVAKTVLNSASRYRWRRRVELVDEGMFTDQDDAKPAQLPALETSVVLGDSSMDAELTERVRALLPAPGESPASPVADPGGFTERVVFGNLGPLLWRDWCGHLSASEHEALRTELDLDMAATTGPLVDRARQMAWYLSAELLIDEDNSRLSADKDGNAEAAKDFQRSLLKLFSDLTGVPAESSAVDWDPDNEELLRVHSPVSVVGFWLDADCWYYGWPGSDARSGEPIVWQHAGTVPTDTSIGDLAAVVRDRIAARAWPFGGSPPSGRRGPGAGRP
jgi:hypothetical protein